MSTAQTWQTDSTDLDSTLELAMKIGRKLRGGETIELVGDLGAGKTAFVRGLARGTGSTDMVHSPSFTLSNQYSAGQLTLHHFDFHRLAEPGIMERELAEVLDDPQAVAIIEWADVISSVLPANRLTIRITPTAETSRHLTFSCPTKLAYLMPVEN